MIYADHNATTPLCPSAIEAMDEAEKHWGNPASTHTAGRQAFKLLENSRECIADKLGVSPKEIVFTSGGSEADSLALLGSAFHSPKDFRLLTTSVEHAAIEGASHLIEHLGGTVKRLPVDRNGQISFHELEMQLANFKPSLVSIMAANNETGALFPILEIKKLCQKYGVPLHTDAVQAFGKTKPEDWNVADLISLSAHKIQGPKGVGALVIRNGLKLIPTHHGGSQETKRRGGTVNLIGIAGFAGACRGMNCVASEMAKLRDHFESRIEKETEDFEIQCKSVPRVPNTTNIRFKNLQSELLLTAFDIEGLCVSAGSACSSGSISPSRVLLAMGLTPAQAQESLRFSWGPTTTIEEVDKAAQIVVSNVSRIRKRRKANV